VKITVYNEKGGSGKTTLAVHMAVLFNAEFSSLDRHNVGAAWLTRRPQPHSVTAGNWVVDCPPGQDMATAEALASSDIVLVPVRASFNDLVELGHTLRFIKIYSKAKVAFVGSDIDSRTSDESMLREALASYKHPIAGIFTHRASYRRAGISGGLAGDTDPTAAAEAEALIQSIRKIVNGN
jgi:cellulose biosynthesis protein BcsQ